jgi:hypothetical protein
MNDNDFWYEGYACGLSGYDWLTTVMGRLLRAHDRAELASGWKCGRQERADRERADAEAADQRARERQSAAEDAPLPPDDEVPW